MEPNQIDAEIKRLQIDIGVHLVEAGIEAPMRAVVADSCERVCDLACADRDAAGLERNHRGASAHRQVIEGAAGAADDLQLAAALSRCCRMRRRQRLRSIPFAFGVLPRAELETADIEVREVDGVVKDRKNPVCGA